MNLKQAKARPGSYRVVAQRTNNLRNSLNWDAPARTTYRLKAVSVTQNGETHRDGRSSGRKKNVGQTLLGRRSEDRHRHSRTQQPGVLH